MARRKRITKITLIRTTREDPHYCMNLTYWDGAFARSYDFFSERQGDNWKLIEKCDDFSGTKESYRRDVGEEAATVEDADERLSQLAMVRVDEEIESEGLDRGKVFKDKTRKQGG